MIARFSLFTVSFVIFVTSNTATAQTITINENIKSNTRISTELPLHPTIYYQGEVSSEPAGSSIYIVDNKGNVVKTLLTPGEKEKEIYWQVHSPSAYRLNIATEDQNAKIHLKMMAFHVKPDQALAPITPVESPLLKQWQSSNLPMTPQAQSRFWCQIKHIGTPLIEPDSKNAVLLTFLWKGGPDTHNVEILGAPYGGHAYMSHLAGTDIWYRTYRVPDNSRLSYRLAPNVPQLNLTAAPQVQRRAVLATIQSDPLNPRPLFAINDNKFGAASTVTLPKAAKDSLTRQQGNPAGSLQTYSLTSTILNNTRSITVYRPNSRYPMTPNSPLLIVFDGTDYLTKVPTPVILDNLIANQTIPPLYAVFIDPISPSQRASEFTPNEPFASFMAKELRPWLCQSLNICTPAHKTVLSGSSFGGLSSMYIAMTHPTQFGNVLSQSGSFWWGPDKSHPQWLLSELAQRTHQPVTVYMNAGRFETQPASANILHNNQQLYHLLKTKGYQVTFDEVSGGHDYFSWRVMLAKGLETLLGSTHSE